MPVSQSVNPLCSIMFCGVGLWPALWPLTQLSDRSTLQYFTQQNVDRTLHLALWREMQAAFLRLVSLPPPTPCSFIFTRSDRASARIATNARIPSSVERMF